MFRSFRRDLLLGGLLLSASAAIGPACAQGPSNDRQRITVPEGSRLRSELTIAVVAATQVQRTLELSGIVEADPARSVRVLPPGAGRVVDVKVQPGDRVAAQQELAVMYVGGLGRAQFDSRSSPALPTVAHEPTDEDRIEIPVIGDWAAADGQAAAEWEHSSAQLRAFGAPVNGSQNNRLLSLRAPVGGSITELRIKLGADVTPAVSMMTIANLDAICVTLSVPTKDVDLLVGQPVQLRLPAYPGEHFTGEARPVGSASENSAPNTNIKIMVQNPDARLKLNMSASARFLGLETVPIIPVAAVVSNRNVVFVEIEPWIFEAREVKLDRLEDGQAIVASGVKVGDHVVAAGAARLLEFQKQ
jgi:membrane fusion protein, heavy metal efflux system